MSQEVCQSGFFITFEGPEGSGKTTQCTRLLEALRRASIPTVTTREPGATRLGKAIRQLLLDPDSPHPAPRTELMLYLADRAEHVERVIRPALLRGEVVLCDRYVDSTIAYQGFGRGMDINALTRLNAFATGDLMPDLTLILDLPAARGLRRAHEAKGSHDRLEQEPSDFHERVRAGYLNLAQSAPKGELTRFVVIDASGDVDTVAEKIRDAVAQFCELAI